MGRGPQIMFWEITKKADGSARKKVAVSLLFRQTCSLIFQSAALESMYQREEIFVRYGGGMLHWQLQDSAGRRERRTLFLNS